MILILELSFSTSSFKLGVGTGWIQADAGWPCMLCAHAVYTSCRGESCTGCKSRLKIACRILPVLRLSFCDWIGNFEAADFYSRNLLENSEFQTYNRNKIIYCENIRTGSTSTLPKELSVAVVLTVCFQLHCSSARMN